MVLAAPCFRQGAPGLHGVVVIVRDDLTTEPPAHFRLVSDHDLFEIVVCLDYTASISPTPTRGRGDAQFCSGSFPLVRHGVRHSPRSRHALACARTAAPVKVGRRPPRRGRLDRRGKGRARIKRLDLFSLHQLAGSLVVESIAEALLGNRWNIVLVHAHIITPRRQRSSPEGPRPASFRQAGLGRAASLAAR